MFAASEAAPPNVSASFSPISLKSAPLLMTAVRLGSRRLRLDVSPWYAFDSASLTVLRSLPVAAEMSSAMPSRSCASVTSPVARTRLPSAGRSTASEVEVASSILAMNSSLAATASSVAPVTAWIWRASSSCCAASSTAAFSDAPAAAVSAPSAAVAGTNAFFMAKPTFSEVFVSF